MKQQHARKLSSKVEATTPCVHPLCRDHAIYFEARVGGRKALAYCRAHHLEFKYLQHVVRQRAHNAKTYVPRRVLQPCGTPAAAARHRRRGEPVCDPCRIADNERTAEYKARSKARALR